MTSKQKRRFQSFRRVQGWAVAHQDFINAAPAPVLTHLQALDVVVTGIDANAVAQDRQHKLTTLDVTDATQYRTAVRDAMQPITQVAKGLRGSIFGISAISSMPKSHADNEALLTAATSMADSATLFKTPLIDHGLQPNFIETLQSAAAALKSSVDARGQAKSAGVGATNGIHAGLVEGDKLVSFIDAGLMPLIRKNAVTLASWRNAKRVTTKGAVGVATPLAATTPGVATPSTTPVATTAPVAGAVHTA